LRKKQQRQSKAVAEISPIPVYFALFLLGGVFSAKANSRVDMMVSPHTNSCSFAQIPWTDCLLTKVCMRSIVVHYKPGIERVLKRYIYLVIPFRIQTQFLLANFCSLPLRTQPCQNLISVAKKDNMMLHSFNPSAH
jgi:hypothetical protein